MHTGEQCEEVLLLDELRDGDELAVVGVAAEQLAGLVGPVARPQDLGLVLHKYNRDYQRWACDNSFNNCDNATTIRKMLVTRRQNGVSHIVLIR